MQKVLQFEILESMITFFFHEMVRIPPKTKYMALVASSLDIIDRKSTNFSNPRVEIQNHLFFDFLRIFETSN